MYWWYLMYLRSLEAALGCYATANRTYGGFDTLSAWTRERAKAEYLLWELRADLEEYGVEGLAEERSERR